MQILPDMPTQSSIEKKRKSALELNLDLSREIERGRILRRLTKKEMAQYLGLSVGGLNKKLSAESQWKLSEVAIIADWWHVSLDEFIAPPAGQPAVLSIAGDEDLER